MYRERYPFDGNMGQSFNADLPSIGARTIPLTQSVNFYTKQLTGHGASLLNYTGSKTLSIVSQKDSGNNNVTIFQIGQNALSWRGASSTYSSAPPVAVAGPYTVVVTDGTYQSTVTIPVLAGSCIREMTHVVDGGRWITDSMYTTDGTSAANGAGQLDIVITNTSAIAKGDTIWCRDGQFNPAGHLDYFEPFTSATYGGAGQITIRSENVDVSVDQWGYPNRQHGFRIGVLYFSPSTNGPTPIVFRDISWYFNNAVAAKSFVPSNNSTSYTGLEFHNCGFMNGPLPVSIDGCTAIVALQGNSIVQDCTFKLIGNGIQTRGDPGFLGVATSPTIQRNVFQQVRDGDGIDIGGNSFNNLITDNVLFDQHPTVGGHCDFIVLGGLTGGATGALGTISRNKQVSAIAQGIFIGDIVSGNYTSGLIENNLLHCTGGNNILCDFCGNVIVRWNTSVGPEANPGAITVELGTNATLTRNVSNGYTITQLGTVTQTPASQKTVVNTTSAYQAVWPGYPNGGVFTDYSIAGITAAFTPNVGGFATLSQSGCFDNTGAYNATP